MKCEEIYKVSIMKRNGGERNNYFFCLEDGKVCLDKDGRYLDKDAMQWAIEKIEQITKMKEKIDL